MNTLEEEIAMANYMGISLEEMREKYNSTLVPSRYQGYMSGFAEYMLNKLGKDNFESYRLYGKTEAINKITNLMEKRIIGQIEKQTYCLLLIAREVMIKKSCI